METKEDMEICPGCVLIKTGLEDIKKNENKNPLWMLFVKRFQCTCSECGAKWIL